MMETTKTEVRGYWNEKKVKIKELYSNVTDSDLYFKDGKEKEMIEMLSNKIGKTREELVEIIVGLK
jgi:uncharacterized protein YjbJ (UPF0337 family)